MRHDLQEFNPNENAYQAAYAQHEDCTSAWFGISLTHHALCDIDFVTPRLDDGAIPVRGKYEGVCGSSLRNLMYVHCLDVSFPLWIFRLLCVY